uniref:Ribosomal protein S3 n=1 Tax=Amphibolis griffithii TaxID=926552 RepID=A0A1Z1R260_9LILI|nr:ribosomal protein S3 [Amphibolis griffithii]
MPRKGNSISVRLDLHRSSDPSRFSDYYYGKSVYQDVNLRSYFGSIRPPTISTFGFRLGRCLLLHFPKGTFIHFFLPRRPLRLKRRGKSRPGKKKGKKKGQWWAFGKVGPIGCLHSSKGTEEERTDVRSRGAFGGAEWGGLRREKQNEIQIWPTKMQRYGIHHGRSPSGKNHPSKAKELRVSGASAHPKYVFLVNYRDFLIALRKTKLFQFLDPNQSRSDGPRSHILKRTLPTVRLSFHYSVMQYWKNTKNKMHFDPGVVLNHFVSSPSTMRGAKKGVKHRIRSRIAFFVESSTREKKCLAAAGTTKTTISLFPFFGATFFFPRDGVGSTLKGREQLWSQLSPKCWNLMGKDKVMELIEKCRELGSTGELIKGMEMMIEIILILRNRGIPYGYNFYLNEVKKMRSFLSERTKTETSIESVKIQSVYQSASPIAQDISLKPRNKRRSFRSIFSNIVKASRRREGVEGIRLCCSGRSSGAEIARTECGKSGKTSCNVFNQKIDYAPAEVSTRYGISGVKVWISYR